MSTKETDADWVDAKDFLEGLRGGPLTFGDMICSLRKCEEMSQTAMAEKLGISKARLCDIEKGRRLVSADRAIEWARILEHSEFLFLSLVLEGIVKRTGLDVEVDLKPKKALPKARTKKSQAA